MVKTSTLVVALSAAFIAGSSASYFADMNSETFSSELSSTFDILEGSEVDVPAESDASLTWAPRWMRKFSTWTMKRLGMYCKLHPHRCGKLRSEASGNVDEAGDITEEEFATLMDSPWAQDAGKFLFGEQNNDLESSAEDMDISEGESFSLESLPGPYNTNPRKHCDLPWTRPCKGKKTKDGDQRIPPTEAEKMRDFYCRIHPYRCKNKK